MVLGCIPVRVDIPVVAGSPVEEDRRHSCSRQEPVDSLVQDILEI